MVMKAQDVPEAASVLTGVAAAAHKRRMARASPSLVQQGGERRNDKLKRRFAVFRFLSVP